MIELSIVTPVYNRRELVVRSISSSLKLLCLGLAKELIVVDDASTDGSYEAICHEFAKEIDRGLVKLYRLEKNLGVTGAKNFGAQQAQGDYIAFMDSDDVFWVNEAKGIIEVIGSNLDNDLFFFRCSDILTQELVGEEVGEYNLTLKGMINDGTPGECLPVISKSAMDSFPYRADLRGCESLSYFEMLKEGYKGYVSSRVVRGYSAENSDRLSNNQGLENRAHLLLKYNLILLSYYPHMAWRRRIYTMGRVVWYFFLFVKRTFKRVFVRRYN